MSLRNDSIKDALGSKLEQWLNNPPDLYEMDEAYTNYGKLKALVRKIQRQIEAIEDEIMLEQDKPRSNEARKAKLTATASLKDTLANAEADLAIAETEVKKLEYRRSMFSAAIYRTKLTYEI